MRVTGLLAPGPLPQGPGRLLSLATRAALLTPTFTAVAIHTNYDCEPSVYRFVGPKRIERIAGVYEAGVAAVA